MWVGGSVWGLPRPQMTAPPCLSNIPAAGVWFDRVSLPEGSVRPNTHSAPSPPQVRLQEEKKLSACRLLANSMQRVAALTREVRLYGIRFPTQRVSLAITSIHKFASLKHMYPRLAASVLITVYTVMRRLLRQYNGFEVHTTIFDTTSLLLPSILPCDSSSLPVSGLTGSKRKRLRLTLSSSSSFCYAISCTSLDAVHQHVGLDAVYHQTLLTPYNAF